MIVFDPETAETLPVEVWNPVIVVVEVAVYVPASGIENVHWPAESVDPESVNEFGPEIEIDAPEIAEPSHASTVTVIEPENSVVVVCEGC